MHTQNDGDEQRVSIRKLSTTMARVLRELSRDFDRRVTQMLRQRGHPDISLSHQVVFANIGLGQARVTQLAQRAQITQQAMGKTLRELEDLGYVERAVDETDRRAKAIRLTPRGLQFVADAIAITGEVRLDYANKIGHTELDELEARLRDAAIKLELDYLPPNWAAAGDGD